MYRRTKEQVESFIKKPYRPAFMMEVMDMYDEIEKLRTQVKDLTTECDSLKQQVESPGYELAKAIEKYIDQTCVKDWQVPGIIHEEVDKYLRVNVSTDGYYEEYSGQREHYHKSTAEVYWDNDYE